MDTRQRQLTLAVVLALVAGLLPAGAVAPSSATSACGQVVVHDLRTESAIQAVNESGNLTSTLSHTTVRLVDAPGFVRLTLENPNGYCVAFRVEIAPEIVRPAELGEVESNNETYTATWSARQNLSSGAVYTHVAVTLPARTSATFAPSEARIVTLEWTADAKRAGGSWLATANDLVDGLLGGDGDGLAKNEYRITPANGSERVSVSKIGPNGTRISSWRATYTLDGDTHPVGQDAEAPVYYVEHPDRITFMFNHPNATVTFTANPGPIDQLAYRTNSYLSGWDELGDLLPFGALAGGGRAW